MTLRNVTLKEIDSKSKHSKVVCLFLNTLIDEVNYLKKEVEKLRKHKK